MTISTVKSTRVSNDFDVVPKVIEASGVDGGHLRVKFDTIEAATTSLDEAGDIILMLPLKSSDRLYSLKIFNDDLDSGGTSGAVDIGLYNGPDKFVTSAGTAYAAYGVLDADVFASAVTQLTAADKVGTEVRYEAASTYSEIKLADKRLWEALNLPEDPGKDFVVGITVTTQMTTPVAGTISFVAVVAR